MNCNLLTMSFQIIWWYRLELLYITLLNENRNNKVEGSESEPFFNIHKMAPISHERYFLFYALMEAFELVTVRCLFSMTLVNVHKVVIFFVEFTEFLSYPSKFCCPKRQALTLWIDHITNNDNMLNGPH